MACEAKLTDGFREEGPEGSISHSAFKNWESESAL